MDKEPLSERLRKLAAHLRTAPDMAYWNEAETVAAAAVEIDRNDEDNRIDGEMINHHLEIENRRLKEKASQKNAVLTRVIEIFEHDAFTGAFQMAAIHGYEYHGPTLTLDEIRVALNNYVSSEPRMNTAQENEER